MTSAYLFMILWHFRGFGSSSHTVSAGGGHLSDRENLIRGKRRCPSSNCDAEFLFFPSVMSDPTQWFTLNRLYRNCIFQLRHSCRWGREKRSHTVRVGCVNINAKHISANKKKANKYKKPRVALALQGLQQSLPVSLFKKIPFSVCVFPATYRDFECADLSVRALLQVWGATGVCVSPELHSASQQLLILIKKGWETITTHPVPPCFITVRKGDSVFISLTYRIWPLSPLK